MFVFMPFQALADGYAPNTVEQKIMDWLYDNGYVNEGYAYVLTYDSDDNGAGTTGAYQFVTVPDTVPEGFHLNVDVNSIECVAEQDVIGADDVELRYDYGESLIYIKFDDYGNYYSIDQSKISYNVYDEVILNNMDIYNLDTFDSLNNVVYLANYTYSSVVIPDFIDFYNSEEGGLVIIEPGDSLLVANYHNDKSYFMIDCEYQKNNEYRMLTYTSDGRLIKQNKVASSYGLESYIDNSDTYVIENTGNIDLNFWFSDEELIDTMSYYNYFFSESDDEPVETQWQSVNLNDGDLFLSTNEDIVSRDLLIPYDPLNNKRFVITIMNGGVKRQETVDIYNDYTISLAPNDVLMLYKVRGDSDIVQLENGKGVVYRDALNNPNVPDEFMTSDIFSLYQNEQDLADSEDDLSDIEEQIQEIKGIRGLLTKLYQDVVFLFDTLISFVSMLITKSGQVLEVFGDVFSVLPNDFVRVMVVGITVTIIVALVRK
ncbi:MAG: hypothetical protein FH761_19310 [Firmicutes bacterium]|nr:hypothetical protein [Bacillota bacterium]